MICGKQMVLAGQEDAACSATHRAKAAVHHGGQHDGASAVLHGRSRVEAAAGTFSYQRGKPRHLFAHGGRHCGRSCAASCCHPAHQLDTECMATNTLSMRAATTGLEGCVSKDGRPALIGFGNCAHSGVAADVHCVPPLHD